MASKTIILCCIVMLLTQKINAEEIFQKIVPTQPAIINGSVVQPTRAYRTKNMLKGAAVAAAIGAGIAAVVGAYSVYNNQEKNSDQQQQNENDQW
uniref:Early transcribed membrane protein n=1 Tax=Panagrolaimus sp. ES5 TaxID=591445 RepID=A0AC34GNN7_9BILA